MKEMNLGRILIENRHKRGITQEELATHIGVSKGAVSKWETNSSLPDISLLPPSFTRAPMFFKGVHHTIRKIDLVEKSMSYSITLREP